MTLSQANIEKISKSKSNAELLRSRAEALPDVNAEEARLQYERLAHQRGATAQQIIQAKQEYERRRRIEQKKALFYERARSYEQRENKQRAKQDYLQKLDEIRHAQQEGASQEQVRRLRVEARSLRQESKDSIRELSGSGARARARMISEEQKRLERRRRYAENEELFRRNPASRPRKVKKDSRVLLGTAAEWSARFASVQAKKQARKEAKEGDGNVLGRNVMSDMFLAQELKREFGFVPRDRKTGRVVNPFNENKSPLVGELLMKNKQDESDAQGFRRFVGERYGEYERAKQDVKKDLQKGDVASAFLHAPEVVTSGARVFGSAYALGEYERAKTNPLGYAAETALYYGTGYAVSKAFGVGASIVKGLDVAVSTKNAMSIAAKSVLIGGGAYMVAKEYEGANNLVSVGKVSSKLTREFAAMGAGAATERFISTLPERVVLKRYAAESRSFEFSTGREVVSDRFAVPREIRVKAGQGEYSLLKRSPASVYEGDSPGRATVTVMRSKKSGEVFSVGVGDGQYSSYNTKVFFRKYTLVERARGGTSKIRIFKERVVPVNKRAGPYKAIYETTTRTPKRKVSVTYSDMMADATLAEWAVGSRGGSVRVRASKVYSEEFPVVEGIASVKTVSETRVASPRTTWSFDLTGRPRSVVFEDVPLKMSNKLSEPEPNLISKNNKGFIVRAEPVTHTRFLSSGNVQGSVVFEFEPRKVVLGKKASFSYGKRGSFDDYLNEGFGEVKVTRPHGLTSEKVFEFDVYKPAGSSSYSYKRGSVPLAGFVYGTSKKSREGNVYNNFFGSDKKSVFGDVIIPVSKSSLSGRSGFNNRVDFFFKSVPDLRFRAGSKKRLRGRQRFGSLLDVPPSVPSSPGVPPVPSSPGTPIGTPPKRQHSNDPFHSLIGRKKKEKSGYFEKRFFLKKFL